jgi:hypothetical protein
MTGNDVIQTTGIAPARVRLFQPTQRPTARNGEWITTAWGRCCVDGRLGQRHADLLEAMLFCAEKRHDEDAGTIRLLIDPARVRKVMSESRYSQKQLWVLIREIKKCVIEIDTSKMRLMGGIIDTAEYTKKETRRNPLTGEERRLWTIRLGKAWAELMRLDKTLNYDPTPIARLEHGISQAVARHILSHKDEPNGGWKMDGLIRAVAGECSTQGMKDARHRLRADSVGLAAIGVKIENDRLRRVAHPPDTVAHPPDEVAHPPDGCTPAQVSLGFSGLLRPEMADSLTEPAIQANPTPAPNPPLSGLGSAVDPAPIGAPALGHHQHNVPIRTNRPRTGLHDTGAPVPSATHPSPASGDSDALARDADGAR